MPYSSIPTVTDGQVLSASFLNLLGSNQAFLFGVANNANTPFNSFRAVHVTMDRSTMEWFLRHRVPWLHWRVISLGSPWNYARIYYNGIKVAQSTAGASSWTGSFNLSSWAGLPNLLGAWATAVAYDDDVGGDGNGGNGDDGSVVTQGGGYYRCKLAHTSAAGNQPGVGGSWTTYWDLLPLPVVGAICGTWVDVNFDAGVEIGVDYIVETDSPSF